jgi:hypothetical protein
VIPKGLLIARGAAVAAGLGLIVFSAVFGATLTRERPSSPTGVYTSPYQSHGGTTFISQGERWLVRAETGGALALFAALSLIELYYRRRRREAVHD